MRDGKAFAKEKAEARRQQLSGIRRKRRIRMGLVLAGITLLVLAVAQLYNSHLFDLREVRVIGNKRLSTPEVVRASGVKRGMNLLKLPVATVRKRLLANPWIKEATVDRRLLSTLELRVTERKPVAVLTAGGGFYLVDDASFAIAKVPGTENSLLPVISDVDGAKVAVGTTVRSAPLSNAIDVLETLDPAIRETVALVSAPSADKLSLFTRDDVEILYGGASDTDLKNKVLLRLLREAKGRLVRIDIRAARNPVVTRVETIP